jgi:low temperature requirement protein LtrA
VSSVSVPQQTARLLRDRTGVQRVTNIELFFDLVYVFAVTQLSHYLLGHADLRGALQTGLLLLMVWLVWSYTTWVTNWLDPDLMAVRLLLVALMLVSLAMSVSLPRAFEDLGLWVGAAYAVQQIGRSVFMVIALRGHPLEANFQRILAWCVVSSAFAIAGGLAHGDARALLRRPARRAGRLLHARSGPVTHLGLDHRGRPLRRALPGVHPDRAG